VKTKAKKKRALIHSPPLPAPSDATMAATQPLPLPVLAVVGSGFATSAYLLRHRSWSDR
jgi:hypothetical protein